MRAEYREDKRLNEVENLIKADIDFCGCVSITTSRYLVKRKGMSYPAIARIAEDLKRGNNE